MPDQLPPLIKPYPWDEYLIETVKKTAAPKFICYPFKKTALVAGWGSRISKEIRLDLALEDNIPIFRRQGGGCTVFLDPGNLIISAAFPASGFLNIRHHFNNCTLWLMNGLKKTGLKDIYQDGISDIVLGNQKIGGSCFKRSKGFAYFSASILVSPDVDLMEKYLKPPPRQPGYRKGRTHKKFITSVSRFLEGMNTLDFSAILAKNLKIHEFT